VFFIKVAMEFHRLSAAFYTQFSQCEEILTKEDRPYYVLLLELDGLVYAIPLRSHITHPYCFIADNSSFCIMPLFFPEIFSPGTCS
jgi:protein AbiQ